MVVPKPVRDRLRLKAGATVEIVDQPGGFTVRVKDRPEHARSTREILEELWKKHPYDGPPISDEDMHRAVLTMAAEQDIKTQTS